MLNDSPSRLEGFLRLSAIIGNKKSGEKGLIPISKSAWWNGVRSGKFPSPVKLGPRTTAWRAKDIAELLRGLGVQK